jgi:hypothetical protein
MQKGHQRTKPEHKGTLALLFSLLVNGLESGFFETSRA